MDLSNILSGVEPISSDLSKEITANVFKGCEKCNYTGFISFVKDGYTFSQECDCYRNAQHEKRRVKGNIPAKYAYCDFTLDKTVKSTLLNPHEVKKNHIKDSNNKVVKIEYNVTFSKATETNINKFGQKYVDVSTTYLSQNPMRKCVSLLALGPVGSGKTNLACAIGNKFLEKGLNVYYLKVEQYMDYIIKDGFNNPDLKDKRDFLNCFKSHAENCHLLILDELGFEYHSDNGYTLSKIKDLLRTRAEKLYPTIITTNLTPNDLVRIYQEEVFSMFCEDYLFLNVTTKEDYRMEMSKKLTEDFDLDSLV